MDWLFNNSKAEKSLAVNAQKIVAEMHGHLEKEKLRNKELESVIFKFQSLCTQSLEEELERLEKRSMELAHEKAEIDRQIKEKKLILGNMRDEIHSILISKDQSGHTRADLKAASDSDSIGAFPNKKGSATLEETYLEELELLMACRKIEETLLFILHRSDAPDEAIGYLPSNESPCSVGCFRIGNCSVRPMKVGLYPLLSSNFILLLAFCYPILIYHNIYN